MRSSSAQRLAELVSASSISRVRVFAWRDLDDAEAGGSERHASEVLKRWAAAGLRVELRTSHVAGRSTYVERDGYGVERRGGRYQVFLQAFQHGIRRDRNNFDAVVEIWNGMPFFTPLWSRKKPNLIILHHVHGEMWALSLPKSLARVGWWIEHWLAPMLYRRSKISTLSPSSATEIESKLHLKDVEVVSPGIGEHFVHGGSKSPYPLVIAVGRLVPVKRFSDLIEIFVRTHEVVPTARFEIIGEGHLRSHLQELIGQRKASEWITLRGHVSDNDLVDHYQRAWLLTSFSLREGWGMSITEAAACGTPAVVSDIAGHRDATDGGTTGILCSSSEQMVETLCELLVNRDKLDQMATAAQSSAEIYDWDLTAEKLFERLLS